ncbi:MAG: chitobiase/beta-hexosaminidase C-terminal domain-containing protein [Cyclobacteriaceae bacterium]|nr:chitobiase/beta-hexosaminidase C-terminal domain-containing protein [Cyclobacteriaceae bacterium]
MEKIKKTLPNVIFFVQFFLAFLLFFEKYVAIPVFLQPLGRMHPLVLHFPVVLVFLMLGLFLIKKQLDESAYKVLHFYALSLTVLTTSLTALMGFFLSMEEGYAPGQMTWHKWTGVGLSFIVYGMLLSSQKEKIYRALMFSSVLFVVVTGHFGAELTHGESFVFAPVMGEEELVITENTPIYTGFINPILKAKCNSCHNPGKHKGDLDMSSYTLMMEGGENGPVLIAGNPSESDLIRRALLPPDDEDHMPPDGKPQLTSREMTLLESWIKFGASDTLTLAHLQKEDTLFVLASHMMEQPTTGKKGPVYTFDYADEAVVASLNNPFRSVRQITSDAPALEASIFVKEAYQPEFLTGLEAVGEQIVTLNLAYMPVKDSDMSTIAQLVNLEKLVLNYTDIEGKNLDILKSCNSLKSLSLSGTAVGPDLIKSIAPLKSLKELYVWDTKLTSEEIGKLKEQYPALMVQEGFIPDEKEILKLNPPMLGNKGVVLSKGENIVLKHTIPGVTIRYTLDESVPDSINGTEYTGPVPVKNIGTIRAYAFKEGWEKSNVSSHRYFINGYKPDSAVILTTPAAEYPGQGGETIINGRNAETVAFRSREWIAFRENPMIAVLAFTKDIPEVTTMTLGYAIMVGRRIMPPTSVELWGGNDLDHLTLIARGSPPQLEKGRGDTESGFEMTFDAVSYKYYKVIAHPLKKLPGWHRNKGEMGLISVDEVYFY